MNTHRRITDPVEAMAQRVAERVIELVLHVVDVNALLAQVDVNALLARIDVAAVLEQVDLAVPWHVSSPVNHVPVSQKG